MIKNYQRKHLRAPFKGSVLYADGDTVFKAIALNISEEGIEIDTIPKFAESHEVSMLISLPQVPALKNFSLLQLQTFSKEFYPHHVIRLNAYIVRRQELSQTNDVSYSARYGMKIIHIEDKDKKEIENYIKNFASNLIYLQTMIDSFNTDDETKLRARTLATILGYENVGRIALLRTAVGHDYKSLQWL